MPSRAVLHTLRSEGPGRPQNHHVSPRANVATFAELETDLIKMRGKKPKLSKKQHCELRRIYDTRDYSISDLAEVFAVSRPTIYRTLQRTEGAT